MLVKMVIYRVFNRQVWILIEICNMIDYCSCSCKHWGFGELMNHQMAWRYQRYDRSGTYGIPELKRRYNYNISRHGERHHMPGKFGNPKILALNTRRKWYFTKTSRGTIFNTGKVSTAWPFHVGFLKRGYPKMDGL